MDEPERQVIEAMRYLSSVCDGANSEDGQGFNKFDSSFGHSIAAQSRTRSLSWPQLNASWRIANKYQVQIANAGLPFPTKSEWDRYTLERSAQAAAGPSGTISCTEEQFLVAFDYDAGLVQKIREVKGQFGGSWDAANKLHVVNMAAGPTLKQEFPTFKWTSEAEALLVRGQAAAEEAAEEEKIERELFDQKTAILLESAGDLSQPIGGRTLFKHQQDGVRLMLQQRGVILADEMGLGKTTSALIAAKAYDLPIIVIAPVSLQANWLREAALLSVPISVHSWAKIPEPLEQTQYVLIADEAHYAQTWGTYVLDEETGELVVKGTKRTAQYLKLARHENCQAVIQLTGTPIKNGRPSNIFPLLFAIGHPLSWNKSKFERYYCAAGPTNFSRWDITGAAHLDELHHNIKDVLIRRLKKDCLDLPEKMRDYRSAEVSDEAEMVYQQGLKALADDYWRRVNEGEISGNAEAMVFLGHYRRLGAIAKIDSAMEIVEEVVEEGGQVIVFSDFGEPLQTISQRLERLGISWVMLTGATPNKERQGLVDAFQEGRAKVFLSTHKAGGVGITLTAAQTVILLDRPWTPGDALQSEDRAHRIGQTGTVTVYWLQYGPADEKVDPILVQKAERIELVLAGKRKTLRGVGSISDVAKELADLVFGAVREEESA